MGRTAGAALALCLTVVPAVALAPLPPCEVVESGMRVSGAESFGFYGSGFATETYYNDLEQDPGADGVYDHLQVTVPQLEGFSGYRVVDCKSGEFLAIGEYDGNARSLLATEFLRGKVQQEKPFAMADVKRAAQALYKGRDDVKILPLRETEQICSCKAYGGQ